MSTPVLIGRVVAMQKGGLLPAQSINANVLKFLHRNSFLPDHFSRVNQMDSLF